MAVNDSGRGYSPTPRGTGEPRLDHRPIEARKLGCLRESCVKRVLDIAVAATALTFLAPFFGLLVLIVRLDSPGPTFFSQRRVGRPGITGLWQVSGRDRLSAPEMLALDLEYVRSRSFWLDMKILARTVPAVLGELRSKRASREPELRPQPRA